MKKLAWVTVVAVLVVLVFSVNALTEFYVIPVTKNSYAPVARTGQTSLERTHDDGDLEKGVQWPDPRFTDNDDGTVTDNLTGLVWLKKANSEYASWNEAIDFCKNLNDGESGLSDGSSAGEWRLLNIRELQSLIDYGSYNPVLPSGYPFTSLIATYEYWTSTTYDGNGDIAWYIDIYDGDLYLHDKGNDHHVWPVRDGN
jgi:hypothetical protein